MKEHPILFKPEMVAAIIAERKTQTRRIAFAATDDANPEHPPHSPWLRGDGKWQLLTGKANVAYEHNSKRCPYGKPGDRLFVKESFTIIDYWEDDRAVQVMYEDATAPVVRLTDAEWEKFIKWQEKTVRKTSLFMFKSLARVWLEITGVKVERASAISEADAIAEGVTFPDYLDGHKDKYRIAFKDLFASINGAESWEKWVWAIEFRVLSNTGIPSTFK